MAIDVSVILVSYNVSGFLEGCLRSIKKEISCRYEIIAVDNGSTDGSSEMLRKNHPDVILIQNASNLGFARANNQAFRLAVGKYVFMLNPDTLVLDRAVDRLFRFMEEHPEAGASGPKNLGSDLTPQLNCHHFPSLLLAAFEILQLNRRFPRSRLFGRESMTYWNYDQVRAVDWITGCSLMLRRDLLDRCGFLDEKYFLYGEECDLSYRMKRLGFPTFFCPDASIIHFGGQSSRTQSRFDVHSGTITKYFYETRYHFFRKNYGRIREILLRTAHVFYFGARLLKNGIWIYGKDRGLRISEARTVLEVTLGGARSRPAEGPKT
jgi:GT2 family glycosyltransferase